MQQLNFIIAAFQKESVAFIEKEFSSESEEFFQSWPWWIFDDLSCGVLVRVVDCYLYEGHKVLFRAALALLKTFYKSLKTNTELYQTAKSSGLIPTFANYAKTLSLSAEEFLKIAFKFPRFSKADIAKLSSKLEMEAKANRLSRAGRRHRSSEEVREAGGGRAGHPFSTPQHRPSGAYPVHHLTSQLLSKDQVRPRSSHLSQSHKQIVVFRFCQFGINFRRGLSQSNPR